MGFWCQDYYEDVAKMVSIMDRKYYIVLQGFNDNESEVEDGWLYSKTPNGKYLIQALLLSEIDPSLWTRKQLLKEHGTTSIHEDYDCDERPEFSVEITADNAKTFIKRWGKEAQKLWN